MANKLYGFGSNITKRNDYTRVGRKNKTSNKEFIKICKMTQQGLKDHLTQWLTKYYDTVIRGDGFVYARGDIPVLVTAHMDTVHKEKVKDFYEYVDKDHNNRHIISSPQGIGGDDRCGIYMIKEIIKSGLKPYVLFCEEEEKGGIGSEKFCRTTYINELADMLFLIELDRANNNDLVFYEDLNNDFHMFCEEAAHPYTEATGSFSDISNLCPTCGVAGVNISCGYYNAHATDEYVVLEEMEESIKKTIELIQKGIENKTQFEYIPRPRRAYNNYGYGLGRSNYSIWDDPYDFEDSYYYRYQRAAEKAEKAEFIQSKEPREWVFWDTDGMEYLARGNTFDEAVGCLMLQNSWLCWDDILDFDDYTDRYQSIGKIANSEEDKEPEKEEKSIGSSLFDDDDDDDNEDTANQDLWNMLEKFALESLENDDENDDVKEVV